MFALCLVQEEMVKTGFCLKKVFASRKCLQARKHVPIGGTNQSQNHMAKHIIWLLRNRGKLWEGRRRKSDSSSAGDRDNIEIASSDS